jgi:CSLREA domain-containing protein
MKTRTLLHSLAGIAFLALAALPALATTRTVTTLNDNGPGSLRDTIAIAASGDTIVFGVTGTISLTSGRLVVNKALTISGPGANNLIIERAADASPNFGIISFGGGTSTLSGVTIRNGQALFDPFNGGNEADGGGILNGTTLTVNDSVISNNVANVGGGVYNGGTLTLNNCVLSNNNVLQYCEGQNNCIHRSGNGGGLYNHGTARLYNCTLSQNDSQFGSAIFNDGDMPSIENSTFDGNTGYTFVHFADFQGITGPVSATFQNCTFNQFETTAIYNDSTGAGNSAAVTVKSCTFVGSPGREIIACFDSGGGNSTLTIGNTILQSYAGVSLFSGGGSGTISSLGYNLCRDNGAGYLTGPQDQINVDAMLDPFGLQYNGGYTKTIAVVDGSPAIDHGKSFGLTTDQRGSPRPVDNPEVFPAPGGDGSDIGAYEGSVEARQRGDSSFVVNTAADHDDGTCGPLDCTLREAIRTANEIGPANMVSFPSGVTGTITLDRNLGQLNITDPVTITGPGARLLAISGGGYIPVFSNSSSSGIATISGLTIRDGSNAFGGSAGDTKQGGAIYNSGSLIFNDCAFTHNYVRGADGVTSGNGGAGQGGAIYNAASLTLNRCLFYRSNSGNVAGGGNGGSNSSQFGSGGVGGDGQGGAIFNATGATLIANNSTFEENSVAGGQGGNGGFIGGNGGSGVGGAVFNLGTMTLTACTVNGNAASFGPGGTGNSPSNNGFAGAARASVVTAAGSGVVRNTLIAGNIGATSRDVDGTFVSQGFNLLGTADHSTGFTAVTDQKGTDSTPLNPQLGTLQNNGGPTDTMALLTGSSALDKGHSFGLTVDQRGFPRTLDSPYIANATNGDGSDIGAFEADAPQSAATLVVTTTEDHDDGACGFIDCTLREAINAANSLAGDNTVTFAPSVSGTVQLASLLPDVSTNVTLQGPGARILAISGNNTYRVFSFTGGISSISGLTIRDGRMVGGLNGTVSGGGISNQGNVTFTDCALTNNNVFGGGAISGNGGNGNGGGVYNSGVLTLARCTLSANGASGGIGADASRSTPAGRGGSGSGGAIYNDAAGTLTLSDCTLSANIGNGGAGGNGGNIGGAGGAGHAGLFSNGALMVVDCTVSANSGTGGSGGTGTSNGTTGAATGGLQNGGTALVRNTISAGNSGADVSGAFNSQGYNLIGPLGGATGFVGTGDQTGVIDPKLSAVHNNGGRTDTMALLSSSSAVNAGDPNAPSRDQRYYLRNGAPDIGAFEFSGAFAPIIAVSRKTHGTAGTFDINLPLTGAVGIECRNGTTEQVIMSFATPVTVANVTATPDPNKPGATGSVSSFNVNGSEVTVNLSGVSNAQRLTVNLSNVGDGVNTNSALSIPMGVLLGDVNGNGVLTNADVSLVKAQVAAGGNVDPLGSNFRDDVNANGVITNADVSLTKAQVAAGAQLP